MAITKVVESRTKIHDQVPRDRLYFRPLFNSCASLCLLTQLFPVEEDVLTLTSHPTNRAHSTRTVPKRQFT